MQPLVTIVIPVYNRTLLVRKAIASILAQTYHNWELIIVDDGSTDDTVQSIRSMTDAGISVIELQHTGHIGSLRNTGVRAGKGEWVAFLDSDDEWVLAKLELQFQALKQSGLRWCYGNFELMDESGQTIPFKAGGYHPISGWIIKQLLTTEAYVNIGSVLLQRSLFEEVGGLSVNPALVSRGDYEFILRVALKAEVIALPNTVGRVLEHPGRTTNSHKDGQERTALAYEIFLQTNPPKELKRLAKRRRGAHLADAASRNLGSGNYAVACRQLAGALTGGATWRRWCTAFYQGVRARIAN